jgi:hypothetical protein
VSVAAEQLSFLIPVAGLTPVSKDRANYLLAKWEHYLGPVSRPFGTECWALEVESEAVAVAVSASTVSEHVAYHQTIPVWQAGGGCQVGKLTYRVRLRRDQIVELARQWATQPMLRLWREIAAPRWPHWPVIAAVAYSQNKRHKGAIYRWDGWTRVADDVGHSGGGGAWARRRYATAAAHGRKSLWLWRYPATGG